jgi:hypothetical protein
MTTPGLSKEYRLTVDASDVVVGSVLLPENKDDIYLPNCYFSLMYDKDQKKVINDCRIK